MKHKFIIFTSILIAVAGGLFFVSPTAQAANIGDTCKIDTDCQGYVCIGGLCGKCGAPGPSSSCTGQGGYCQENGLCGRAQTSGGGVIDACTQASDCPNDGFACVSGFCSSVAVGASCQTDTDCGKNHVCSNGSCSTPPAVAAPSDAGTRSVEPVLPKLQIPIPGIQFSNIKVRPGENVSIPWIMEYIQGIYKYLLGLAIFLAIIMISIAGFRWLTSGGNSSIIGDAKKQIANAIIGLALAFGVAVILQTINPQLINLSNIEIKSIAPEVLTVAEDSEADIIPEGTANPIGTPTWNYQTFDCANPPAAAGVADTKSVTSYHCTGIEGNVTTLPEMQAALCHAGEIAQQQGYTLRLTSSYRSFDTQVAIWCGLQGDCKANHPNPADRKKYCAVPGYSNHGLGRAVDVALVKDGKQLFYINSKTQCQVDPKIVAALANIFYQADSSWQRYDAEIWHFEFGTNIPLRSKTTSLPPQCGNK